MMSAIQEAIDYFLKTGMHTRVDALRKEQQKADAAQRTLTGMGYYWDGGEYFKPPQNTIRVRALVGDDEQAIINVAKIS